VLKLVNLERSPEISDRRVLVDMKNSAYPGLKGKLNRVASQIDATIIESCLVEGFSLSQTQSRKLLQIPSRHFTSSKISSCD